MSDAAKRPTDEQLTEWSNEPWNFPVYYDDDHDGYLQMMAIELIQARATLARVRGLALAPFESVPTIAVAQAIAKRR
ncbi:hypothetical protein [Rhodococcoides fascians]|uniref:hypothetical protein n=1 Tax=Rhodococcoides fascians TaxID=1828 RepID=UPI00055B428F|nr:hypothetical protein [Rhodococcus fascians]